MREIKFKGKAKEDDMYGWVKKGGWVSGNLIVDDGCYYIGSGYADKWGDDNYVEVILETVGQYTGLKDKNRREIYEGDILIVSRKREDGKLIEKPYLVVVVWIDWLCGFGLKDIKYDRVEFFQDIEYKIIGNIHDNPELLKEV